MMTPTDAIISLLAEHRGISGPQAQARLAEMGITLSRGRVSKILQQQRPARRSIEDGLRRAEEILRNNPHMGVDQLERQLRAEWYEVSRTVLRPHIKSVRRHLTGGARPDRLDASRDAIAQRWPGGRNDTTAEWADWLRSQQLPVPVRSTLGIWLRRLNGGPRAHVRARSTPRRPVIQSATPTAQQPRQPADQPPTQPAMSNAKWERHCAATLGQRTQLAKSLAAGGLIGQ